jgi:hypothetical protein
VLSTVQVTLEQGAYGPGVERFEYFRRVARIAQRKQSPESLREVQDLYDTYFLNSPDWEAENARA